MEHKMFDAASYLFWYKFLFVTELILAEGLTTYTLNKRKHFGVRVVVSVLLLYGVALVYPILGYNEWYTSVMFFSLFSATVIALKACYDESWINVLFCAIIAYTAQHIAYELNSLVTLVL